MLNIKSIGRSKHQGNIMYIIKERPPKIEDETKIMLDGRAFEIKGIISIDNKPKIGLIGIFL